MSTTLQDLGTGHQPTIQQAIATIGVLFATGAVSAVSGPLAVFLAIGIGTGQYFFGLPIAFAIGQVVFVGLYPAAGPIEYFIIGESGLTLMLLSATLGQPAWIRSLIAALVISVIVGGGTWVVFHSTEMVWSSGSFLLVLTALVAYGFHRYERVQLGLVNRE